MKLICVVNGERFESTLRWRPDTDGGYFSDIRLESKLGKYYGYHISDVKLIIDIKEVSNPVLAKFYATKGTDNVCEKDCCCISTKDNFYILNIGKGSCVYHILEDDTYCVTRMYQLFKPKEYLNIRIVIYKLKTPSDRLFLSSVFSTITVSYNTKY
jgi:hypothetical protein